MALSRKKSRQIVVEGISYRWAVSMDSGYDVVVVQHDSGTGQRLEAQTSLWRRPGEHRRITPAGVSALITYALTNGWVPDSLGPPMRVQDIDKQVELFT
ncbi:MAG: hypothetical protein GY939_07350 [Actinomycetia bacterium]|nr:hypothetical protein [Actinomycetes bacterium]